MDAESFYDKLLASLGPIGNVRSSKPAEQPAQKVERPPTPPAPDPPPPPAGPSETWAEPIAPTLPEEGTNITTTSPEPISPSTETPSRGISGDDVQIEVDSRPTTIGSVGGQANESGNAPAAPPAPKSSAALEAELRAKLLAASRKRKAASGPLRSPAAPKQRPPRGSPVFTTVSVSVPEESHVSPPPIATSNTNLALPPRPPQREGFRLRIKLPFPPSSSSDILVETERLPLTTPISAILDLFNRRSPHDCLYFPSPSPMLALTDDESEDPAACLPTGQRFYRDPPRGSERLPGWRDLAAARGGPSWDGKAIGNLRSTLEDVATIAGAEVVDCEMRCEPARQILPEEPEPEWSATPIDEDNNENDGHWHNSHQQWQPPHQFQWAAPPALPLPPFLPPTPTFAPAPWAGHASLPTPDTEPAKTPRWIPGHKDYDNAGWVYGFQTPQHHEAEREEEGVMAVGPVPDKKGGGSRRRGRTGDKRKRRERSDRRGSGGAGRGGGSGM